MKQNLLIAVGATFCLLGGNAANGQECVRVEKDTALLNESAGGAKPLLAPGDAVGLVAYRPKANVPFSVATALAVSGTGNAAQPGKPFVVGAKFESDLRAAVASASAERGALRITFVDAQAKVLRVDDGLPFYLAASESDAAKRTAACGATLVAGAAAPAANTGTDEEGGPASPYQCAVVAREKGLERRPFESWVLFNSTGVMCHAPDLLRQRDRIRFGMVLMKGEARPDAMSASVASCTLPTPGPVILAPPVRPGDLVLHSARPVTEAYELSQLGQPVECASSAPVVSVTVTRGTTAAPAKAQTLSLFERHTGVVHLGVLQSSLREQDFGLRALNGQTTIVNREAEGRGPEYMAMVVVQAIPRYFQSGLSYPGRDLLHDNEALDRVGLVLGFGLKEPAKRFALGLSYEVARGINVVAAHEWLKRNRLNGVSVGDTFSGAATDIPTRKEWSRGWSIGLSFDIGYVTQIFTTKK